MSTCPVEQRGRPDCEIDQLLAGDVPGAVVSALQADPDIDWIHIAFDGMSGGILNTLEEADLLDRVKVSGVASERVEGAPHDGRSVQGPLGCWLIQANTRPRNVCYLRCPNLAQVMPNWSIVPRHAIEPPSMAQTTPLTNEASSLAR